jgi:hypothetical protein
LASDQPPSIRELYDEQVSNDPSPPDSRFFMPGWRSVLDRIVLGSIGFRSDLNQHTEGHFKNHPS